MDAARRLAIDYVPLDSLKPHARNARTHSAGQVEQLAASLRQFGWTNPVLVDAEGGIVAGHGRVLAARQIGVAEVPVVRMEGLTAEQLRAYVIADNQLALNAGWDREILQSEVALLKQAGFELDVLGFNAVTLADLLGEDDRDLDATPPVPIKPASRLGDVWVLGTHRLVCGDCTDPGAVALALNGVRPHLMVTDPPYGINYSAGWRDKALPAKKESKKDGAGRATGAVLNDNRSDWRQAWALFPGDVVYVWHAGNMAHVVASSIIDSGFDIRAQIIWAKQQLVIGRGHYHPQHEPCWYAVRKSATGHWSGDRKQTTLWHIDKPQKSETGHSTQKPVECMRRPIENNSSPGQAVCEPFSGSGTTIIAAEVTGRACHAIELSPAYVDVAVRRWQTLTGAQAVHADGESFDERAAAALMS